MSEGRKEGGESGTSVVLHDESGRWPSPLFTMIARLSRLCRVVRGYIPRCLLPVRQQRHAQLDRYVRNRVDIFCSQAVLRLGRISPESVTWGHAGFMFGALPLAALGKGTRVRVRYVVLQPYEKLELTELLYLLGLRSWSRPPSPSLPLGCLLLDQPWMFSAREAPDQPPPLKGRRLRFL